MPNDSQFSGPGRSFVDADERDRLVGAGGLVVDPRRTRPRYFDGRFLAARDLTYDQQYVLTRHADLGRIAGSGVVTGLEVSSGSEATRARISAGLGVTPSGESVVLPESIEVDLLDLRQSQLLDAHFGLRRERTALGRVRTGAFVLALRPVEYSANPRRGYPTSIQGERRTEDHDIVEATAVTLVPWPVSLGGSPDEVRRRLAHDVFVVQRGAGLPTDLVPVAMVHLDGSSVSWIDPELVRREPDPTLDPFGLGTSSRAVRAAHVRQYAAHLRWVLGSGARAISAAEHFESLPAVGELPADAIDRTSFEQRFFPSQVEVDLTIVPEDELGPLLEEHLHLPPIDLHGDADALRSVSVMVLVPIPRERYDTVEARLTDAVPGSGGIPGNIDIIRNPRLSLTRPTGGLTPPLDRVRSSDALVERISASRIGTGMRIAERIPGVIRLRNAPSAWSSVLDEATEVAGADGMLWYLRRRNVPMGSELAGAVIDIDARDSEDDA